MVSPGLHHGLPPLYSPIFKLYPLIVNGSFPKMPGSFERQGFEPLRFWIENSSRHFAGENHDARISTMIPRTHKINQQIGEASFNGGWMI